MFETDCVDSQNSLRFQWRTGVSCAGGVSLPDDISGIPCRMLASSTNLGELVRQSLEFVRSNGLNSCVVEFVGVVRARVSLVVEVVRHFLLCHLTRQLVLSTA